MRRSARSIDDAPAIGAPVLLDTTVYSDTLQGRSSAVLDTFIRFRTCNHSAVCLAKLMHAFGRLDPADPRSKLSLASIRGTILDIPAHRFAAPNVETWSAAGILAGFLFRLGDYPSGTECKCLSDVLIYLQARKLGIPVVTGNLKDFDSLHQLVPDGHILPYRRAA